MKKILTTLLILASFNVFSAGYSNWAVPTTIELVSGGVLIHGEFGDPNACTKSNFMVIKRGRTNVTV